MKKIVINGLFLNQKITGIQRYALEIIKELDKLVAEIDIELAIPKGYVRSIALKNITIKEVGHLKGFLWEQISFPIYLYLHHAIGLCLLNIVPIIKPNCIVTIHDISYRVNPHFFTGIRFSLSRYWHCFQYVLITCFAIHIFTVSEFSKKEIIKYYKIKSEKITVTYNAWQHFYKEIDDGLIDKFNLVSREYFFAMSTIAKNKNTNWIIQCAKNNPNNLFVIAGNFDKVKFDEIISYKSDNVVFIGRVSDNEAASLMKNCRAFLFPSFYEGFGLPPLEALSLGVPVIVSNSSCLQEIFGDSVHYIDPFIPNINLEKLIADDVSLSENTLKKFDWFISAKLIKFFIIDSLRCFNKYKACEKH